MGVSRNFQFESVRADGGRVSDRPSPTAHRTSRAPVHRFRTRPSALSEVRQLIAHARSLPTTFSPPPPNMSAPETTASPTKRPAEDEVPEVVEAKKYVSARLCRVAARRRACAAAPRADAKAGTRCADTVFAGRRLTSPHRLSRPPSRRRPRPSLRPSPWPPSLRLTPTTRTLEVSPPSFGTWCDERNEGLRAPARGSRTRRGARSPRHEEHHRGPPHP